MTASSGPYSRPLRRRDLLVTGLILLGVIYGVQLFVELTHILAVLFLGGVVGVALTPLADGLARHKVPRVASILVVYGIGVGLLAALGWYAVDSISSELQHLNDVQGRYHSIAQRFNLPSADEAKNFISAHASGLAGGVETGVFRTVGALLDIGTILVTGVLFAVTKDRIRGVVLSLLHPDQREPTSDMMDLLGHRVRFAVLSLFLAMLAVGVLTYAGLRLLGMPFPLVLAAVAFVTEILPFIGPWIGYVPALLVAFTQGWVMVIEVSALYFAVQEFEAHVIVPVLHSRVNQVPAMLIVTSVLIGGALLGVLGALLALPVAVIAYTLFFEWIVPWRQRQFGDEEPAA